MTYEGFLRIGGVEVVNTERARGYTTTTDCPERWISSDVECVSLADALGDVRYDFADIDKAPWYDASLADMSSRFYGVVGLEISGPTNSTRSASLTEGVNDGGVIGRTRKGMRGLRVRVTIMARGRDALDYGSQWLSSVFDGTCSQHGDACSTTDAEFLADCPPPRGTVPVEGGGERPRADEEYAELVNPLRRFVHDIAVTSGPIDVEEFEPSNGFYGKTIEFTISSERAWVYGITKPLVLTPTLPSIVQDTPYNLIPSPSAELASGTITVATNLATNPSLETDGTDWFGGVGPGAITAPMIAHGRVVNELSASGVGSYRTVFTATEASASAGEFTVLYLLRAPKGRCSIGLWAAEVLMAGAPVRQDIRIEASWMNGDTLLRTDLLGDVPVNGGFASRSGIVPPAGANFLFIRARARLTSWNAGTIVRLYADALSVTVP